MPITVITEVSDVTKRGDNSPWTFYSVLRKGDGGGIITSKPRTVHPAGGVLEVTLDPGPAIIEHGKKIYPVTIPETLADDEDLWTIIEAAVAFPPQTSQQQLDDAVGKYVEANREQFRTHAVPILSGPNAGKAQWVDANGDNVGAPVTWDQVISTAVAQLAATAAANAVTPGIVSTDIAGRAPAVQDMGGGLGRIGLGGAFGPTFPWPGTGWSALSGKPSLGATGLVGNGTTNDRAALANSDSAAVGASLPLMLLPGVYRVSSNLTINAAVWFTPGAILKPDNGVTITLAGGIASAPPSQIFDHSAGGKVVIRRVMGLPVHWWGAVGDGVADDTTPIKWALASSAAGYNWALGSNTCPPVWLTGIHLITDKIVVPVGVGLLGSGAEQCQIISNSAITMLEVAGSSGYGSRNVETGGFRIDGNDIAVGGLSLGYNGGPVVQQRFSRIELMDIAGSGLILDATQNCIFDSIDFHGCDVTLLELNGAGNNLFQRCEFNDSNVCAVRSTRDAGYPGYAFGDFLSPQANTFLKCVFERGSHTKLLDFIYGQRHHFIHCDFAAGSSCTYMIDLSSANNGADTIWNTFDVCNFHWSALTTVPIRNGGFHNTFRDCQFTGHASTTTVFSVSNKTIIERPGFSQPTYVITNTAGDRTANVIYTPSVQRGTTAERNPRGHTGYHSYFDTDLGRIIWWNGVAWIAGEQGGLVCGLYNNSPASPAFFCDIWQQLNMIGVTGPIAPTVSGTPRDGQLARFRFRAIGGPWAITWSPSVFVAGPAALVASLEANKTHLFEFRYDATAVRWVCEKSHATGY